ncbi:hypothetical protein VTK26DRAFT_1594 [Humicola hyalothermophila]
MWGSLVTTNASSGGGAKDDRDRAGSHISGALQRNRLEEELPQNRVFRIVSVVYCPSDARDGSPGQMRHSFVRPLGMGMRILLPLFAHWQSTGGNNIRELGSINRRLRLGQVSSETETRPSSSVISNTWNSSNLQFSVRRSRHSFRHRTPPMPVRGIAGFVPAGEADNIDNRNKLCNLSLLPPGPMFP